MLAYKLDNVRPFKNERFDQSDIAVLSFQSHIFKIFPSVQFQSTLPSCIFDLPALTELSLDATTVQTTAFPTDIVYRGKPYFDDSCPSKVYGGLSILDLHPFEHNFSGSETFDSQYFGSCMYEQPSEISHVLYCSQRVREHGFSLSYLLHSKSIYCN
jgi:hypothetical protein